MKKKIVLGIIIIVLSLFLTGCKNKTAMTAEDFTNAMTKKEYKLVDKRLLSNYYEETNIITAEIAEDNYIEFLILKSDEDAKKFYTTNKNYFDNSITSMKVKTDINIANYNTFTMSANKKYIVLSRVDNTIIVVESQEAQKDEIKKLIKELGY